MPGTAACTMCDALRLAEHAAEVESAAWVDCGETGAVRAGTWTYWDPGWLLGMELAGATLGGYRLGTCRTGAGGMRPSVRQGRHYHTASGRRSLADVLRNADVVSLHCPLRAETNCLIGTRELDAMKKNSDLAQYQPLIAG